MSWILVQATGQCFDTRVGQVLYLLWKYSYLYWNPATVLCAGNRSSWEGFFPNLGDLSCNQLTLQNASMLLQEFLLLWDRQWWKLKLEATCEWHCSSVARVWHLGFLLFSWQYLFKCCCFSVAFFILSDLLQLVVVLMGIQPSLN